MLGINKIREPKTLMIDDGLKRELSVLIRKNVLSARKCQDMAEKFLKIYVGSERDFFKVLQKVIDLSRTIDEIKVKRSGFKKTTRVSNHIINCLFSMAATQVNASKKEFKISEKLKKAAQDDNSDLSWFSPKLNSFHDQMANNMNTKSWIKNIRAPGAEFLLNSLKKELPDFSTSTNDLMKELLNLRKYGVKNCYFQDGICHSVNDVWLFSDFLEIERLSMSSKFYLGSEKSFIANISIANKNDVIGVPLDLKTDMRKGGRWEIQSTTFPIKRNFLWSIDWTGHLYAYSTYFSFPLKELFVSMGKEIEYEIVRLSHVMRLYDLLVPITIVSEMPPLPTHKAGIWETVKSLGRSDLINPDLIIPRIKKMESGPRFISEELQREVEKARQITKNRSEKSRHKVTGFVRDLPVGHNASLRAKDLAWEEQRIILEEGETYVKTHKRGTGETTKGVHRAHRC